MKKLLLVLAVIAMASFLFVGCIPGTTTPDTDTDTDTDGVAICPTVAVTSQVEVGGKNFVKAGSQTVTVTFAVPTEPVSVYVGAALKDNPVGVPSGAIEVVLYTADGGLTYTGTVVFAGDCDEAYIYVITCDTCAPCKYPYTVDGLGPYAAIAVDIDDCTCAGCALTFRSTSDTDCDVTTENCGDACSGLASWSIDLYASDPFDVCCLVPCVEPIGSDSGVCPVSFTTDCLLDGTQEPTYVVVTLVDQVGNETKYFAIVSFNPDTCDTIEVVQYKPNTLGCTDWDDEVDTPDIVVGKVL